MKDYLKDQLNYIIDPERIVYKEMHNVVKRDKVVAIAPGKEDFHLETKGLLYDQYCQSFALGSSGRISTWERESTTRDPLIIRGLGSTSQKALKHCMQTGRTFYAIDTGYIQPGSKKDYHRITKNSLQYLGPIIDRPQDRLRRLNWSYRKPKIGEKILICPPSDKVMKFYNLDLDQWMKEVVDEIKTRTNRPIEIRLKPSRQERVTNKTIWQALDETYCLVTFNSIAATEAILYSVPAIALAPNAAQVICNTSLNDIKNPTIPTKEEIVKFAAHLSYCQFTEKEMRSGYAWNIIENTKKQ